MPSDRRDPARRAAQLDDLFLAAVELPEDERRAFLDRVLEPNDPLRAEVESLLEADDRADLVLGELREAVDRNLASLGASRGPGDGDGSERTGDRLGPYVLDGLLGRGGMGEVHLAHRDDRTYDARVAIKILPANAVSGDAVARFDRERRILAGLDHPHIARLLDAGTTDRGEPYFVMEHVEGSAVDAYCDAHRLTVDERLRLFLQICQAVEQAHRNLVVHRDLKPANVRVTPGGVPKLLDFGIAKLLEDDDSPGDEGVTRTHVRPMTPNHASPEQIEGGPITTGTDVYGLGLLLYQLLTGRLPHKGEGSLHRATLDRDAPRPSSVCSEEAARLRCVDLSRLRRRLAGDLDAIALEALERNPERRYESAATLAADVKRHLQGLPIEARRPTLGYRVAKFVRRHRVAVSAAVTAVVAVLALSVALAFLSVRLAGERDRARNEQRKAEEVVALMVDLLSAPDPERARGDEVTAREVLDRGAERVGERLSDQPEVRASLLDAIGRVYHGLGLYESADGVLAEAFALRRAILGEEHPETASTLLHLAAARERAGDFSGAETLFRRALATERRVRGADNLTVAGILEKLSELARTRGDYGEAEDLLRHSLAIRERVAPDDALGRSQSLLRLAQILHEQERLADAEILFRETFSIQSRALGEDHPDTMSALSGLADTTRRLGRGAEAERLFRRLLSVQRRVLGERHPRVAYGLTGVGNALIAQDRVAEAVRHFEDALALRRESLGEGHPAVMVSLHNLADVLYRSGDLERAETLFRRTLEGSRRRFPPGFTGLAYPLTGLSQVLLDRGRVAEAEPLLREALRIRTRALGPDNLLTAASMTDLAECLLQQGATEQAEELLEGARRVVQESDAPVPPHQRQKLDVLLAELPPISGPPTQN